MLYKKALITGIYGQDGTLLAKYLFEKGYEILGVVKKIRNEHLVSGFCRIVEIDITDQYLINSLFRQFMPDEFYHLAAVHFSTENEINLVSHHQLLQVNTISTESFARIILNNKPECKFFYAASSQMYTATEHAKIINESTSCNPTTYYGLTKSMGTEIVKFYRNNNNFWGVVGILFNHESNFRSSNFLSRKISLYIADIVHNGYKNKLIIKNINSRVDWSSAFDFIQGMYKSMQHSTPNDYIFASGLLHSVEDMLDVAFKVAGLKWESYVDIEDNSSLKNKSSLVGNPIRAKTDLKWENQITFSETIRTIVINDINSFNS